MSSSKWIFDKNINVWWAIKEDVVNWLVIFSQGHNVNEIVNKISCKHNFVHKQNIFLNFNYMFHLNTVLVYSHFYKILKCKLFSLNESIYNSIGITYDRACTIHSYKTCFSNYFSISHCKPHLKKPLPSRRRLVVHTVDETQSICAIQ